MTYYRAPQPSRGSNTQHWGKIGFTFVDDEEGTTFEIVDVCKCRATRGYFFKYIDVAMLHSTADLDDDDYDYTPCDELLTADWCRWTSRPAVEESGNSKN